MAGIFLHQGKTVEMASGEGKILAAVIPAFLNSLSGQGIQIITPNDYLAKRDFLWMRPIYRRLGISVGLITPNMPSRLRKRNYNTQITYVADKEIGFDF